MTIIIENHAGQQFLKIETKEYSTMAQACKPIFNRYNLSFEALEIFINSYPSGWPTTIEGDKYIAYLKNND